MAESASALRFASWLESIHSDAVFGWRQLKKTRVMSAAAIVSLGLAIGACTSAFRLVDALLLRPLPIANPERLYSIAQSGLGPGGDFRISDSSEYPLFRLMRDAVGDSADLLAISYADRVDVTFPPEDEMVKVTRQFVSGRMFPVFGIRAAAGRVFSERDDQTPGAHPYAVISHDYWKRRFGSDPSAVGHKFRMADTVFEIIGVAAPPFTGTETGTAVDVFLPAMMNPYVTRADASWFRPFAVLKPGIDPGIVRARLQAVSKTFREERATTFTNQSGQFIHRFLNQQTVLERASSGVSGLQREFGRPLILLCVFGALLLCIACANLANLTAARTIARAKEIALRVSLGAGRGRLVQLVLVESLWLGVLSAVTGAALSWWTAPYLVSRINPANNPATLWLPGDWRLAVFSASLAIVATLLFGLLPALRASSMLPMHALKGGAGPHATSRIVHASIALQTALCIVVLFSAGLFRATVDRLTNQPLGFSPERIVTLEARSAKPQALPVWTQVLDRLRLMPGVESAALASWPLLSGNGSNGSIWVNNESVEVLAYFLPVSSEWRNTMRIELLDGRDFRPGETAPGVALVNEAFVQQCFHGANPIGKYFGRGNRPDSRFQVIGVVRDARYRNLREPLTPTAYVPIDTPGTPLASASFIIRTSAADPLAIAPALRREVSRTRPELRVSNVATQTELISRHTVRERLLAVLALFFAAVAMLLAVIGLHGVLYHSVLQRRREIGIRLAIGAPRRDIVRLASARPICMVCMGACLGAGLSFAFAKFAGAVLYGVKPTDLELLMLPAITLILATALACMPAVLRALHVDPVAMLRSE